MSKVMSVLNRVSIHRLICLFALSILLGGCSAQGPDKTYQYATQGLLSGDISKDGRYAVIGSLQNGGSFWDIQGFKRLYDWNHKAKTNSLILTSAISADGRRAITTEEDTMVLWDTTTGKSLQFLKAPSRVYSIALSKDGHFALAGMRDNKAIYFDLQKGLQLFTFSHSAEVRSVGLSEDGKLAITAGDDMTAKVWELDKGKLVHTFKQKNQIKTVAISPKGRYAFTTSQREESIVWDVKTGKALFKLPNRYTNFTTAVFSADGSRLLLGTFSGLIEEVSTDKGEVIKKWQAKPRKLYGSGLSKAIISVGFASNGKNVLALTSDGMLEEFSL
jgi:WD40 repeat protein